MALDLTVLSLSLQELSFSRQSYAHVIATMTSSPSSDSKLGLNSISEDDDQEE